MREIIVKILSTILYKLNKTDSFNEMYEKLLIYAKSNGEDYIQLNVCKSTYAGIFVKAYINNFNWVEGKTIEECLDKLEKYKNIKPEESIIKEILI
jgi:hypothetical protein